MNLNEWKLKEGISLYNNNGVKHYSNALLIAVIVGGNRAITIAKEFDGDMSKLSRFTLYQLTELGFTSAEAEKIQSAIELGKRVITLPHSASPVLNTPCRTAKYFRDRFSEIDSSEEVLAAFCDNHLRILAFDLICKGTVNSTEFDIRNLCRKALINNAVQLCIAHNHPSGIVEPSGLDLDITHRVITACDLLNLKLIDHLIIGEYDYYSLKEKTSLFQ